MMRKKTTLANLDNYVIQNNTCNDLKIIPFQIKFDLKAPELKTKGLKKKVKKIKEIINKTEDLSQ